MEKRLGRIPVIVLTIMAAVVTSILRYVQLKSALDHTGKIMAGAGKGPLTWICLAFAVLAVVYCFFLQKRERMQSKGKTSVVITLVAAFLMALGSAVRCNVHMLLALGGFVAAICWVAVALIRRQEATPSAALLMLPALHFALELIVEFRGWSRDPLILDYCFDLFALICVMCATYHLAGFSFGKGKRRLTVFYCICGVIFGAIAAAGQVSGAAQDPAQLSALLIQVGNVLWLLVNLWLLMEEE